MSKTMLRIVAIVMIVSIGTIKSLPKLSLHRQQHLMRLQQQHLMRLQQ